MKLRNVLADKVIDLVGMRVDNGTQAQIWQDVFGENQLWKLDPVPARLLDKATTGPEARHQESRPQDDPHPDGEENVRQSRPADK